MTRLARLVARFRPELDVFPGDVAGTLADVVGRLAPAFGGEASRDDLSGEPDGVGGVVRRGPYERLVPTEWGIRMASPLEFARRASTGEHVFFDVARKVPAAPRGIVVLFDTGPDVLGACRVVELAVLVLLAARARASHAAFGFQCLHHLGEAPFARVDEGSVRAFLVARTGLRVTPAMRETWRRRYDSSELWFVGAPRSIGAVERSVALAERVHLGPRTIDVEVRTKHAERRVALELPESGMLERVLRDPWRARPDVAHGGGNLVVGANGESAYYRERPQSLVRVRLGAPEKHGSRFDMPAGTEIVAVGERPGRVVWVGVSKGEALLRLTKPLRKRTGLEWTCRFSRPEKHWPLGRLFAFADPVAAVIPSPTGAVLRIEFERGAVEELATSLSAFVPMGPISALAVDKPAMRLVIVQLRSAIPGPPLGDPCSGEITIHTLGSAADPEVVVASEQADGTLRIVRKFLRRWDDKAPEMLRPPTGSTVVGIDTSPHALYVLERDRSVLTLFGRNGSRTLASEDGPIEEVAVSHRRGVVVYVTRSGHLGVVTRTGQCVVRRSLEEL